MRKQIHFKFRRVVFEVSFFVGNSVAWGHTFCDKKVENENMTRRARKMKERRKKGEKIGLKSNFCYQ